MFYVSGTIPKNRFSQLAHNDPVKVSNNRSLYLRTIIINFVLHLQQFLELKRTRDNTQSFTRRTHSWKTSEV